MNQNKNCWVQITSGYGPEECALAVRLVSLKLIKEAKELDIDAKLLDVVTGERSETWVSSLISLTGKDLNLLTSKWRGTVKWICKSPFRSNHKRKNWFVSVNILYPINFKLFEFDENQVVFTTMKSSGPGGQKINKTDTAVRATYKLTGLTATAREERSQYLNKKLALAKLSALLHKEFVRKDITEEKEKWSMHTQIERGNPIRIFVGFDMIEK